MAKSSTAEILPNGHSETDSFELQSDGRLRCKPFVKWAGGKTQMIPELVKRMPKSYFRYFEPFVGGGALFFHLQPKRSYLSEINPELINAYQVIKSNVEGLLRDLTTHVHSAEYYYWIRDIDRAPEYRNWSPTQRASRFIYLNKTCYNGLYRVNSKGFFNTPFGRYKNPTIVDAFNLRACSRVLQNTQVELAGFQAVEEESRPGDLVYFDPPYHPRSGTANFTTYAAGGFAEEQQRDLRKCVDRLSKNGVNVMVSNSDTPLIRELYSRYKIDEVEELRAINSKGERRGKITELIIRNY